MSSVYHLPQSDHGAPSRLNLATHANTLCAYLRDYHMNLTVQELHRSIERRFMIYLILSCWGKMYRRMMTWAALGVIRSLTTINSDRLESALKNSSLSDDEPVVDQHLARWLNSNDMSADRFNTLIELGQAWNRELTSPSLDSLKKATVDFQSTGVYCRTTFHDFHHLLVRLLLVFARGLKKLHTMSRKPDKRHMMPQAAKATVAVARALLIVAHSPSLKRHLEILGSYPETLLVPSINHEGMYQDFAAKYDILSSTAITQPKVVDITSKNAEEGPQLAPSGSSGASRAPVRLAVNANKENVATPSSPRIVDAPGNGKHEESMSVNDVEERGEEGAPPALVQLAVNANKENVLHHRCPREWQT